MHALIRRAAALLARKETCQMLNHMGWEGAHCATHKKTRACNFNACVLFACRFSMAAWLWINDLLMAQRYLCCTPHELVCVRCVPFCLSCDGDWFCFLSLDCRDCARICMCGWAVDVICHDENCAPFLIQSAMPYVDEGCEPSRQFVRKETQKKKNNKTIPEI